MPPHDETAPPELGPRWKGSRDVALNGIAAGKQAEIDGVTGATL